MHLTLRRRIKLTRHISDVAPNEFDSLLRDVWNCVKRRNERIVISTILKPL